MNRSRGHGGWKSEDSTRTDTGISIRGKLISSPIPFPDDDEFPFRGRVTRISIPRESDEVEKRLELEASGNEDYHGQGEDDDYAEKMNIDPSDFIPPKPSYNPPTPPTARPNAIRESHTHIIAYPVTETSKRHTSSFKSAFSKLFKRKSKDSPAPRPYQQHRSDSTPLNAILKNPTPPPQHRSVSLPINELSESLQSHAITTEEFRFPLPPTTDRDSGVQLQDSIIQVDEQAKPRRATLSGLWTPRTPAYADWTGLSPRPASSHAKGNTAADDYDDETGVGIALTSGSNHPNRRSRSVGELSRVAGFHTRGRSDEIRYWREGDHPDVPPTPSVYDVDQASMFLLPRSPREAIVKPAFMNKGNAVGNGEAEAPQPFNFGPMVGTAGNRRNENASLEDRVLKIEDRVDELEKGMLRSGNYALTDHLAVQDISRGTTARERSRSATRPRTGISEASSTQQNYQEVQPQGLTPQSHSSYYSRPRSTVSANTSNAELEAAKRSPSPADQETTAQNNARPLSNANTIRAMPSPAADETYAALLKTILAERAARQELEAVVLKLQQRLQTAAWTSYPAGQRAARARKGDEQYIDGQFLDLERDDSSLDDAQYESDEYPTPSDEKGLFGDEIFGDASFTRGARTAPRVVSLSQMTLGRGQGEMNF